MFERLVPTTVAATLAAVILSACGTTASDDDKTARGPWSFTDGSGKVVKTDKTPRRIIAHGHAAAALISFGIKPIAIYTDTKVSADPGLKDLDLSGIEIIGEEWGEIDVEKAATLNPDLIVADWWPVEKAHSGMEEGVKASSKKIAELAPVVGSSQGDSIVTLIEGYEDLAKSLGANLSTVADNKERFEKAVAGFKTATEAKPGLTALAVSPYGDDYAIAVPKYAPELLDLTSWGLDVLEPASPDKEFPYWETLSWEHADKYQPDLLLLDDRNYPGNLDEARKQPTWDSIKAAKAGATTPWPAYWLHTYPNYAAQLERLTKAINGADTSIGS